MSLLPTTPLIPHPSRAHDLLSAIRHGNLRALYHLYRHFSIIAPHPIITYPSLSPSSTLPHTSPPPTAELLATAIAYDQPTVLSDLLQTFPGVRIGPELLELCVAESSVACLDLLLGVDRGCVDTCVRVSERGEGASLLACAVWLGGEREVEDGDGVRVESWGDGGERARCLLHYGAGVNVGRYGGLSTLRCALRVGRQGVLPPSENVDGEDEEDEEEEEEEEEEETETPFADLGLVQELVDRGASVEGALEDAVELGPQFVAAVLKGRPRPSAREIREALGRAKKAELVILREKMAARRRESVESLREEAEGETKGGGERGGESRHVRVQSVDED